MQWAHFASGGAGGGMRWPNRHPHCLTAGMRSAQGTLARFLPLIDWGRLRRRNLNEELRCSSPALASFGCGDEDQAVAWLLRTDTIRRDGTLRREADPLMTSLSVPGLRPGSYRLTLWDTCRGAALHTTTVRHEGPDALCLPALPVATDLAVALRHCTV
jgi:mannan endo-1,4-beta-mannosidase